MEKSYIPTIGLEIHAQLNTASKMFAPEAVMYGAFPNTGVSEVTLALPGVLPSINKEALKKAIMMGIACKSTIANRLLFYRKSYFYPDLPKGYQITQGQLPICSRGHISIPLSPNITKDIYLERIHLEEDTGKSIHSEKSTEIFLDFNRAGTPLIEIVTAPCINSSDEAYIFLTEVRKLVRYLDICDGNMEEGSLRCDVNISVAHKDSESMGSRVEIKNLNSIRSVKMAIDYEVSRHIALLEDRVEVARETRSYNATENCTISLRSKNSTSDYRYFPDPNLPPVSIHPEYVQKLENSMPLLPREYFEKFTQQYKLSDYDAGLLTSSKEIALYFEDVCKMHNNYKSIANWINGPIKAYINDMNIPITDFPIGANYIAQLVDMVETSIVSFTAAVQKIFPILLQNPKSSPKEIAQSMNLLQNTDCDSLIHIIKQVLTQYPDKVLAYKNGKTGVIDMLMGRVIKESGGTFCPKLTKELLLLELSKLA